LLNRVKNLPVKEPWNWPGRIATALVHKNNLFSCG
jgi:hypothetical protein